MRNAHLRLITGDASCKKNERALVWNQRGAPGPRRRSGRARSSWPAQGPGPAGGGAGDCDLELRIANAVPGFQTSGTCAPPPFCNDDTFEPDDTLGAGDRRRPRYHHLGRSRAPGDDDYLAVAAAGAAVSASLTFESTAVLEIALLDSSGNVLASAAGSSPQSVSTAGAVAGTVYVRVRAVGNAQGAYTLSL